jgi:hypothetical protein
MHNPMLDTQATVIKTQKSEEEIKAIRIWPRQHLKQT